MGVCCAGAGCFFGFDFLGVGLLFLAFFFDLAGFGLGIAVFDFEPVGWTLARSAFHFDHGFWIGGVMVCDARIFPLDLLSPAMGLLRSKHIKASRVLLNIHSHERRQRNSARSLEEVWNSRLAGSG